MIVQLVVKGLFLYFLFLVIRSLLKGFSQVKSIKEAMDAHRDSSGAQGPRGAQAKKPAPSGETVEAEFRRL